MRKTPNLKLIGFFTFIGVIIFTSVIGYFISDKLSIDKKNLLVMYFSGSIKGLNIGSPMLFKGVPVGKVVKIDLIVDVDDLNFKTPVFIETNPNRMKSLDVGEGVKRHEVLEALISHGLRGRLVTQSMLTGQLGIEMEIVPNSVLFFRGTKRTNDGVVEIPTLPSVVNELLSQLQDIRLKETVNELNSLLRSVNQFAPDILNEAHNLTKKISKNLDLITVNDNNPVDNLNQTLKSFKEMADSFKNFADYLERNPETLIRGKGKY